MEPDAPTTPHAEYSRRLDACRREATRLERLERLVGGARVSVFVPFAVLFWLFFNQESLALLWALVPVAVFVVLLVRHQQVARALRRAARAVGFYERGLARLEERWAGHGRQGTRFLSDQHPYALDLDLFGRGSLFERLCAAGTRAGEDTLAAWLLAPAAPEVVRERQAAVAELRDRLGLREDLGVLGAAVPDGVDLDALVAWGSAPPLPLGFGTRAAAALLAAAAVATLAAWGFGYTGPTPFVLALMAEGAFALWLAGRVRQVLGPVERRARDLAVLAGLLERLEREPYAAPRLKHLRAELDAAGAPPSRRIRQLFLLLDRLEWKRNFFFAPVALVLLWATRVALAVERWRVASGPAVGRWLAAVGEFEALASLAAYGYENPDDPFPEMVADGPLYDGEGLGHPLIPAARCVRNDLRLGGDARVLVVSGSNMSGKSTMLRTAGVNAVLAQAGAPVRARRLTLSPLAVGATLRIQDSLQEGKSRFYAEITRMRQLVDLAKGPAPLLFLLDEILHGTNSHDRRLGAEAVVRGLVEHGAVGLVTTHDLALTHIVELLAPRAANVHFEDRFEDGAIVFDYRMRPGVVTNSNALALMRAVGLEV